MLQSMGSQKIKHNLASEQQPVFLPGKSHCQGSLEGYTPGKQESQEKLLNPQQNGYVILLKVVPSPLPSCFRGWVADEFWKNVVTFSSHHQKGRGTDHFSGNDSDN